MSQFLTNEQYGNEQDGTYSPSTGTDSVTDSAATGTSGTNSLTATNASFTGGQIILIHQTKGTGAGQWELNKISSYVTGTITTKYPLSFTYATGAQVLVIPQYRTASIAGGVTVTIKSYNGTVGGIFAKMSNSVFTHAGTILGTGLGFSGGAAPGSPAVIGTQGDGTVGAGSASTSANGNGGGGGSVNDGGGGGGGNGVAGSNSSHPGTGGLQVGASNLTTADLGGGGGSGSFGASGTSAGAGGNGGALVFIFAKSPTITGAITLGGNNGTDGGNVSGKTAGGGGTGAGGSCLIKGQVVVLGNNLITALAGSTVGHGFQGGVDGALGAVGRIHVDYSTSISGSTNPTLDSSQDNTLAGNTFFGGIL